MELVKDLNEITYIRIMENSIKLLREKGYTIRKAKNEYRVNNKFIIVYLGLKEVLITSTDVNFNEQSIILNEKTTPDELSNKIIKVFNEEEI